MDMKTNKILEKYIKKIITPVIDITYNISDCI